jgi:hypothetical protein
MTTEQLHICQHALGLDNYGQGSGYRNHYVAGTDDAARCRELVALGHMREYPASELSGGDPVFTVTEVGRSAVRAEIPRPPKLTRSQIRYQQFLAEDSGMTFGEWLKAETQEAPHA